MSSFTDLIRKEIITGYTTDMSAEEESSLTSDVSDPTLLALKQQIVEKTEAATTQAKQLNTLALVLYQELTCAYLSKYYTKRIKDSATALSNYFYNRAIEVSIATNIDRLNILYDHLDKIQNVFDTMLRTGAGIAVNSAYTSSYSMALELFLVYVDAVQLPNTVKEIHNYANRITLDNLRVVMDESGSGGEGGYQKKVKTHFDTNHAKIITLVNNAVDTYKHNGETIKTEFMERVDKVLNHAASMIAMHNNYDELRLSYVGDLAENDIVGTLSSMYSTLENRRSDIDEQNTYLDERYVSTTHVVVELMSSVTKLESQISDYMTGISETLSVVNKNLKLYSGMFDLQSADVDNAKVTVFDEMHSQVDSEAFDSTVTKNKWDLSDENQILDPLYTDSDRPEFYATNEVNFPMSEELEGVDNTSDLKKKVNIDHVKVYKDNTERNIPALNQDIVTEEVLSERLYYCDLLTNLTADEFNQYTYDGIPKLSKMMYYYAALFGNTDETNRVINNWLDLGYIKPSDFSAEFQLKRDVLDNLSKMNMVMVEDYYQSRLNANYPLVFTSLTSVETYPIDRLMIETTDPDKVRYTYYSEAAHDYIPNRVAYMYFQEAISIPNEIDDKVNRFIREVNTAKNKTMKDIIAELGFIYFLKSVISKEELDIIQDYESGTTTELIFPNNRAANFTTDTMRNANAYLRSGDPQLAELYDPESKSGFLSVKTREYTLKAYLDMMLNSRNVTAVSISDMIEGIRTNKRLKEVLGLREERYIDAIHRMNPIEADKK